MTVRMIGGEMLIWSDLDGKHGPGPVRGAVLTPLMASASGRALIVGPHDPDLIAAAPADDLTLLVRGLPDAETLTARYAARPNVTVCCGGLEGLAGTPPYDTVIALDGLDRLGSLEGTDLTWSEALRVLLSVLRPGGSLLLAVENGIGLHRLVALSADPTDTGWAGADPVEPAGLARVRTLLRGAEVDLVRTYAAYPTQTRPTLLLGEAILADDGLAGFLEIALSRALAPTERVLSDPRRLAVDALRHGVATDLAPAWVIVARRRTPQSGAAHGRTNVPAEALIAEGSVRADIRRDADGRWIRHLDGDDADEAVACGRTVADLLIGAGRLRDLPALRQALRAWQDGPQAGVPADRVIVGPDGRLTALAPAGTPEAALRQLAATLIGGSVAHPWPGSSDIDELASTLAAMAGRELDLVALTAAGEDGSDRPDAYAFRELAAARDRLTRELAEAREQLRWHERMLTSREEALHRAQQVIDLLGDTGPARLGKAFVGGVRVARRAAGASLRAVRRRS